MAIKTKQPKIRIELTPEQKEQVKQATGLEVPALELTAEELEERVAPGHGAYHPDTH
jgi:hypothetical protein